MPVPAADVCCRQTEQYPNGRQVVLWGQIAEGVPCQHLPQVAGQPQPVQEPSVFGRQLGRPVEFDPRAFDHGRGRGYPQRRGNAVVEVSPVEAVQRYLVRLGSYRDVLGLEVDRELDLRDGIRFASHRGHGTEREQGTAQG